MKINESKAIHQARIRARAESREGGQTYCQILDDLARSNGHGTWKAMRRANPTVLLERSTGLPWKARIRYATPIDELHRQAYHLAAITDDIENGDPVTYDIACGMLHARPASIVWKDDLVVEFEAVHRHHALGILGCLPHRHLVEAGATLEVEHAGVVQPVPMAPIIDERWRTDDVRHRRDGMVFRSDYEERPYWDSYSDDRILAATTWDWLLGVANMNDAGFIGQAVDALRGHFDGAAFGYLLIKAHKKHQIGVIHPKMPATFYDILEGWEDMYTVEWDSPIQGIDITLTVGVTADGASYLFRGHDYCLHAEEVGDPNDSTNPVVRHRLSLWWQNNKDDPHGTPPLVMHQKGAGMGLWTSRSEDRVFEQLSHLRVLGELPGDERPLLVPPSMTRGVALLGEYDI